MSALDVLTAQSDYLAYYEFGNTSRIAKRTVENSNSSLGCILQIDLIGADAKAADANQILSMLENILRQLGFRTYSDGLDIANLLNKLIFRKRSFMEFDLVINVALPKRLVKPDNPAFQGCRHPFEPRSPEALK